MLVICVGDNSGLHWRSRAAVAAACGEACDVPEKAALPPPMPAEVITAPGATMSTRDVLLEKHVMVESLVSSSRQFANSSPKTSLYVPELGRAPRSPAYVAPTTMGAELQAGDGRSLVEPEFPELTKMLTPLLFNLSRASAIAGCESSQGPA